jgi:peptidyl-prolyl cis-trans isomerase A (cyclophilin A)
MRRMWNGAGRPVRLAYPLLAMLVVLAGCNATTENRHAVPADSPLLNPESPELQATAPETFRAQFETTAGTFILEVVREWSPQGADRFYNLARSGYYDGVRFFRAIDGFMVQFGIHGDPAVNEAWQPRRLPDDPVAQSNERGMVSFAMAGPDSRTTQLFINLADNAQLDDMGFSPIGRIIEGMEAVDAIYTGYGEGAPRGRGPDQGRLREEGNAYLESEFPQLDHIQRVTILDAPVALAAAAAPRLPAR